MGVSRIAFALFLAVGLVSGCGKEQPKGPIAVFTADPSVVLVRVGGRDITVGDFRRRLDYETGINAFSWRHSRAYNPKKEERHLANFTNKRMPQIMPLLIRSALIRNYLVAEFGSDGIENADAVVSNAVRSLAAKVKERKLTLGALSEETGSDAAYIRDQLLAQSREQKALMRFDPTIEDVSEKEIEECFARIDAYVERAVASNRVTWATCSNVLARIRGGMDFKAAGRKYGDSANEAEEWGFFNRDDLANDQRREWAFSAKEGEVGGPFDIEDGLSIVKVVRHEGGTKSPSMASTKVEEVTLARINFLMVEEHPEPRTREYCSKVIRARKTRMARERLYGRLYDETKFEYPSGEKIDYRREE